MELDLKKFLNNVNNENFIKFVIITISSYFLLDENVISSFSDISKSLLSNNINNLITSHGLYYMLIFLYVYLIINSDLSSYQLK